MKVGLESVVRYPGIRLEQPMLLRPDDVHLLDMGLGVFLQDLQGGLRAENFSLRGGQDA